ncbi:hypothetical protein PoB_003277400 [Plakobranchus ocellatus]|uniref:Uncharacterized protein n=1 Tax=Plakobranchus ocellatus TaxID=259542 RepID=A0AAV4AJ58_9GAST|nr:hypothetical protein PoB_003277400 [Plakobranchus ocellatus]
MTDDEMRSADKSYDWRPQGARLKRLEDISRVGLGRKKRWSREWNEDRDLCIPWRSPCTSDEELKRKYSFLKCCNNMVCKCSFWGSNCRCNTRLFV